MLEDLVKEWREALQQGVDEINDTVKGIDQFPVGEKEDRGEVIANIKLALRHIEDARMRLGKVYQAQNGGVSNSEK